MSYLKINYFFIFFIGTITHCLNGCCAFVLSDTPDTPIDPEWIAHRVAPTQSLWNKKIKRVIIEIDRVDNRRPHSNSLKILKKVLLDHLPHVEDVDIRYDKPISIKEYESFFCDGKLNIEKLAKQHQNFQIARNEYLIYLLATPHFSNERAGMFTQLGNNKAMIVLDKKNIQHYAVLYLSEKSAEARVLMHEAGHALGLCHNPSHCLEIGGGHCTNPWCCMYPRDFNYRFILCNLWPAIIGRVNKDFCSECKNDLKKYNTK